MDSRGKVAILFIGSILLAACTNSGKNPALPTTIGNIPTSTPVAAFPVLPTNTPTTDPYATWSTNFQGVSDFSAAGIQTSGAQEQLAIDAANVHSGGKSIRASGYVSTQNPNAYLKVTFSVQGLIGRQSIDLSTKTLSVEVYIPSGSPVSKMDLLIGSEGQYLLARSDTYSRKGEWYTYEADLSEEIAYRTWDMDPSYMTSPGLADADALRVIQNVEWISIGGGAVNSDDEGISYFQVDRLGWKPSGAPAAFDPSVDSLRRYAQARHLLIGGTIQDLDALNDPQYVRHYIQEFNLVMGVMGLPPVEPSGGQYDITATKNGYTAYMPSVFTMGPLADTYHYQMIRRALTEDVPDWIKAKSYAEVKPILENYIQTIVSFYKGKTAVWLLFNELMRYDDTFTGVGLKDRHQTPQTRENNYMPWADSPSDVSLIEDAFRVAKQADPDALLFVNEADCEEEGDREPEMFYQLIARMKKDGTPIDGVALQTHLIIDKNGNVHSVSTDFPILQFNSKDGFSKIAANVERYAALGLKVAFSEVDVNIYNGDIDSTPAGQQRLTQRLQLQADVYRSLMHITLTHSNMPFFFFWDWSDPFAFHYLKNTLWWGYGSRGIFDNAFSPKPDYEAILDELKE